MSLTRGIAPVRLNKDKLQLCTGCKQRTLPSGSDMLKKCNGCNRGLFSQLHYCAGCASLRSCCQVCTYDISEASSTTAQPKESQAAPCEQRKKRALKKISLIDYLKREAEKSSISWEDYLAEVAGSVTEGCGAREKKSERATIRISKSPRIDADERRQVNSLLAEHGYGQQTRDITIGEIYRLAKVDTSNNQRRSRSDTKG